MADDNPTFDTILKPADRHAYKYRSPEKNPGDSKVNESFKKLGIAKIVVWKDPKDWIDHGKKLAQTVKSGKFKYKDQRGLDPRDVRRFHPVPANKGHIPEVEQDAILIDARHGKDAVDELWRLTDPLYPLWLSCWRTEFSARVAAAWKQGKLQVVYDFYCEALGLAAGGPLPAPPNDIITLRDLYLHLLMVAKANKLITDQGGELMKLPYIEGRIDSICVRCLPDTRIKLDFGIPSGKVRPTNGKEGKKAGLVSKHAAAIEEYAKGQWDQTRKRPRSPSEGSEDGITRRRSRWFRQNVSTELADDTEYDEPAGGDVNFEHPVELPPGALSLFTQSGGYQVIYRIRSVEIYDTLAHIFIRAPDLTILEDTTAPQLWREAVLRGGIGGGRLEVSVFTGDLLKDVPAARLAMQDLGREEVPLDVVPVDLLNMTVPAIKKPQTSEGEAIDMEALLLGRYAEKSTEAAAAAGTEQAGTGEAAREE
ncbi:hypothetical protein K4K56_004166 [Colletotrichum sp. SAR 10_98]|nr:hypothetical protein K4K56_004166 [Colletotrichum sp. SAR 10_98]